MIFTGPNKVGKVLFVSFLGFFVILLIIEASGLSTSLHKVPQPRKYNNLRSSAIDHPPRSFKKFPERVNQMAHKGAIMPAIMYGTAWKKGKTKELVELAVRTGFRGVDTACQPKHYHEPGVGEALEALYASGIVRREDIFLQTKFTAIRGQDPDTIPYDTSRPLREQILQSFQVSCRNLKTDYVDSLVMHSPMDRLSDTLIAWKAFEEIHASGGALRLGLSNTYDLDVLRTVYDNAVVKPSVLQNRFYRQSGYDVEVRAFCKEHNITYQSFWTLTGNPHVLSSKIVTSLAAKHGKTAAQILFKYVQQAHGIVPLSGTTSVEHMREDLAVATEVPSLNESEIEQMNAVLGI